MSAALSVVTPRFEAKRAMILDAASAMINERGVKGMSLGGVAERIGLSGTSITYYFRRKDALAAACFDRGLDRLECHVALASAEPDARSRIERLVALGFDAIRQDDGHGPVIASLNDMRATDEPLRAGLLRRYFDLFRQARAFFGESGSAEQRLQRLMRTHVLLETIHALPTWLDRYAVEEHDRVRLRLTRLMTEGLGVDPAARSVTPAPIGGDDVDPGHARFLGAATRLINERGYRGASVERIVAALDVTKGSFYHHLDAKDDLVLTCFRRSLTAIGRAQDQAIAAGGSRACQLSQALATLIAAQLGEATPLLRSTALASLPPELRREAVDGANRIALRFSGMVIDAISEGGVAAVDPLVAGQMIMFALNAAYELRNAVAPVGLARATELYASTLLDGLLVAPA